MTIWCGSGSADPCLWLMDPNPQHCPKQFSSAWGFFLPFFRLFIEASSAYCTWSSFSCPGPPPARTGWGWTAAPPDPAWKGTKFKAVFGILFGNYWCLLFYWLPLACLFHHIIVSCFKSYVILQKATENYVNCRKRLIRNKEAKTKEQQWCCWARFFFSLY